MAFKHHISCATDLAANFGCCRIRIMPDIISKLWRAAIWSRCAVRLESEQTPFSWTGHMRLCSCVIFLLRDQWQIEKWSEAMGAALIGNNFLPITSKISFRMKTKSKSSRPEIYKSLKPCWLLKWASIAKVVGCFPQASRSLPTATGADSETPVFTLPRHTCPSCAACARARPKS